MTAGPAASRSSRLGCSRRHHAELLRLRLEGVDVADVVAPGGGPRVPVAVDDRDAGGGPVRTADLVVEPAAPAGKTGVFALLEYPCSRRLPGRRRRDKQQDQPPDEAPHRTRI